METSEKRKEGVSEECGFAAMMERRTRIVGAIRAFFDQRGFTEVTTPVLIKAPAPEPHIDCPRCGEAFLRASPELQMKKLLAAGMDRIYQIGPCFREGEFGSRHNPEFTMLEWYRANAGYADIRADTEALLAALFEDAGRTRPKTTALTVREAYAELAGWNPFEAWDQDRFDYDMATKIEPAIAEMGGGVFLSGYPPQAASLAKVTGGTAERWEFYLGGMELANAFTELCDEREQRRRFGLSRERRRALGEADYPVDEDFLSSLPSIGSAAGAALGVDRLVMALAGKTRIDEVRAGM